MYIALINIPGLSMRAFIILPCQVFAETLDTYAHVICANAQRQTINYSGQLSVSRRGVQLAGFSLRVTVPLTNLHRDLDFAGAPASVASFFQPFFPPSA